MNIFRHFWRPIILLLLIALTSCTIESSQTFELTTKKTFSDSVQDAEFAIIENNFRIINRLHIGQAIQERGNAKFPHNEVILFCNLSIAEEILKIEPQYINYCPYKITITQSNQKIIIGTRLLPEKTNNRKIDKISEQINKTLHSIVEYTAYDDPFILDEKK